MSIVKLNVPKEIFIRLSNLRYFTCPYNCQRLSSGSFAIAEP